jgi:hypothetical protein
MAFYRKGTGTRIDPMAVWIGRIDPDCDKPRAQNAILSLGLDAVDIRWPTSRGEQLHRSCIVRFGTVQEADACIELTKMKFVDGLCRSGHKLLSTTSTTTHACVQR